MTKEKTETFIAGLWREFKKKNPETAPFEIYSKMGINRQNFYGMISRGRDVSPTRWRDWQKALGMSSSEFTTRAKAYYGF